ncbi:MAG: hypothetical protein H6548_01870 [Chitinophagales bacterium]|nr:hypothetical protein [Chitinophagales bacterium]HAE14834.1 hypothetical protein [Bacteroidota bacterium]MCB9020840.1 hypothetical protein [Chitinophagales bacterium]MCB9031242.1 hypothetical protein [Chitinophagales bacterium]HAE35256.1 hypothetical protein [Bacteroidota bacterium]
MDHHTLQHVEKEAIPALHFSRSEVLPPNPEFHDKRRQLLFQAMILGNTYHSKVRIIFETIEGLCQVETTIWATTEHYVLLKGGVHLPIWCIHDVILP